MTIDSSSEPAPDPSRDRGGWLRSPPAAARLGLLAIGLIGVVAASFGLGKYPISPVLVFKILASRVIPLHETWTGPMQTVVLDIRLPRIFGAIVVGATLASSGAAYQTVFRNPLVSPDILGVSAGAGFGAAIGITVGASAWGVEGLAFGTGILAAATTYAIARSFGGGSPVVLVLGGIMIASFFGALIAILLYLANPFTTLPEITFWLLGGLANVTNAQVWVATLIVLPAAALLFIVRWPVHVMALGSDEAETLGVPQRRLWLVVVLSATVMTAAVVAISGIIGWVGLLIPHMARMIVGPRFPAVLPASALLGAAFLVLVDTVARNAYYGDLPLGCLTAIIGAPFFLLLLIRTYGRAR